MKINLFQYHHPFSAYSLLVHRPTYALYNSKKLPKKHFKIKSLTNIRYSKVKTLYVNLKICNLKNLCFVNYILSMATFSQQCRLEKL